MKFMLNLLFYYSIILVWNISEINFCNAIRKYTRDDLLKLREEVRQMFEHAYSSYLKYAYPYDELRPLSCDGVDTWGSYSLTLIDALDTLAVMGNHTEFQRVVDIITSKADFDANINVSVFETNIRIVGGLLSAHLLSQRAGVQLEPGWPCNGPLLRLAEDVAKRLIAAFDTPTGMPYGTVNLRYGVPLGETSVTCTAGVGTFIIEFGALSRLTGDPVYEEVALNALHSLYQHRSSIGLYGNHIDVLTGRWTAQDSGIGAGVDSYFEYLAKGAILLQLPELMAMFNEGRVGIDKYLKKNDWYLWVSMQKGQVTLPVFQSLEAFWPGVLSLIGDVSAGMKSMHNYHQVWKQYGFTPEFYNIPQGQVGTNREGYPLRPELVESAMYLYRATGDPFLLDIGVDILRSIQHSALTPCGYATIKDTRDHGKENRMESFFLAETTKYLYLLFDPDNFIHNKGQHGRIHTLPSGRECVLDAGGYVFNTEAHPLDPGALHCCSDSAEKKDFYWYASDKMKGDKLKTEEQELVEDAEIHDEEIIPREDFTNPVNLPSALLDIEESQQIGADSLSESSMDIITPSIPVDDEEVTVETLEETLSLEPLGINNDTSYFSDPFKVNVMKYCTSAMLKLTKIQNLLSKKFLEIRSGVDQNHDLFMPVLIKHSEIISLLMDCNAMIKSIYKIVSEFNSQSDTPEKVIQLNEAVLNFSKVFNKLIALYKTTFHRENDQMLYENKNKVKSWNEEISYQVDDGDKVTPITTFNTKPQFTNPEESTPTESETPAFVSTYLDSVALKDTKFDPQQLLERIRMGRSSERNVSWLNKFELLSCRPQPFLTRITLSGEFYDD